jgi:hypothetical protein
MPIIGRESSVLASCDCGNPLAILARKKLKICPSSQWHGTYANSLPQDAPGRAIEKPHRMDRTARGDIGDDQVEKSGRAREFDALDRRAVCPPDRAR